MPALKRLDNQTLRVRPIPAAGIARTTWLDSLSAAIEQDARNFRDRLGEVISADPEDFRQLYIDAITERVRAAAVRGWDEP